MRRWWRPPANFAARKLSTMSMACSLAGAARAQRQHVGIVMFAAQARRFRVVRERRANASDFICGDRHADSRAADEDAEIGMALCDAPGNLDGEIGIVDGRLRPGAHVIDFVAAILQMLLDGILHAKPGMIGAQRDARLFSRRFFLRRGCSAYFFSRHCLAATFPERVSLSGKKPAAILTEGDRHCKHRGLVRDAVAKSVPAETPTPRVFLQGCDSMRLASRNFASMSFYAG